MLFEQRLGWCIASLMGGMGGMGGVATG